MLFLFVNTPQALNRLADLKAGVVDLVLADGSFLDPFVASVKSSSLAKMC